MIGMEFVRHQNILLPRFASFFLTSRGFWSPSFLYSVKMIEMEFVRHQNTYLPLFASFFLVSRGFPSLNFLYSFKKKLVNWFGFYAFFFWYCSSFHKTFIHCTLQSNLAHTNHSNAMNSNIFTTLPIFTSSRQ